MKRKLLMAFALIAFLPAVAEHDPVLVDTSRVVDLDEVVVVSQSKEYMLLRHQPLSSTVLTGTELGSLGARDLRDVADFVPSFVMPNYGARYTSSIYVRGIGSRVNSPSMGIYVDNIPLMSKSAFNSHTYQLDRVDVLRGPQGTLYGINTEGGLVRQYTRNPMNRQGTDINISLGTHFYRNVELAHSQKLTDQLAFSLAGFYNGTNGFFHNETTGDRADDMNEAGARLRLVWQPTSRLSFDFSTDFQWVRQHAFPYGELDLETGCTAAPTTNHNGHYHRSMLNTGLSIHYAADHFDLFSTTSHQYLADRMLMDIDYQPLDYMRMAQRQLQNALTQEIVFKSRTSGPWHWTAGVFGSYQWLKTTAPVYFDQGFNDNLSQTIHDAAYYPMLASMAARMGEEAAAATIERMGGVHINMEIGDVPGLFHTPQANFGLFHESNIDLTDRLTATLGLRYDLSHVKIDYLTSCRAAIDMSVMGVNVKADAVSELMHSESDTYSQLLPKLGLTYRIDDLGSTVYATVAKGYRAGGFNVQMFSDILQTEVNDPQLRAAREDLHLVVEHDAQAYDNIRDAIAYKPEESWNYELGTHLNLFDNLIHADLSAFYMQIRNQQLSVFTEDYGFGRKMVNAGRSYSCGVELTLRGSAFADHLSWALGYGYTHAAFKEYTTKTSADGDAIDYSDKLVPFVPAHTLSAMCDYRFDFSDSFVRSLTVGANLTAQGKTWWDEANTYGQPFYAVLGAHVCADLGHCTVNLWGRNLTDTRFNTFAFSSKATGQELYMAQRGNPFHLGVDVSFSF